MLSNLFAFEAISHQFLTKGCCCANCPKPHYEQLFQFTTMQQEGERGERSIREEKSWGGVERREGGGLGLGRVVGGGEGVGRVGGGEGRQSNLIVAEWIVTACCTATLINYICHRICISCISSCISSFCHCISVFVDMNLNCCICNYSCWTWCGCD